MTKVFKPTGKDVVSPRRLPQTQDDRKRQIQEFREDKEHKRKLKEERFAKIAEKQKQRPTSPKGRGGINVRVRGED